MPDRLVAALMAQQAKKSSYLRYVQLMRVQVLKNLEPEKVRAYLDELLKLSVDLKQEDGLRHCIARAGEVMGMTGCSTEQRAMLHHSLANAFGSLRVLRTGGREDVWEWERDDIERELMHLRRALDHDALMKMPKEDVGRVLSSMAMLLNHVGRFSEAVEYWDRTVAWNPDYVLARGKRGYALTQYAHVLYDREQVEMFLRVAHAELKAAIEGDIDEASAEFFKKRLNWIESNLPRVAFIRDMPLYSVQGGGPEEVYRRWCMEHRLLLNPLNDLGPYLFSSRDVLRTPVTVTPAKGSGAFYHGYFNQIKQAYVSARYLYYEGLSAEEPHFSDCGVALFDTKDYPSYSLSVEKVKAGFSMAYSVLDRVAGFLNHYLNLDIPPHAVTFKTVWYDGQQRSGGLREEFRSRKNWPLRGLFWLSKALYEDNPGLRDSIEPDAEELAEIRFNLEHRYLKLHERSDFSSAGDALRDELAYSVLRGDFEAKTLRLLKMARTALTNLCLAVHLEEKRRQAAASGLSSQLPTISLKVMDQSSNSWLERHD